MLGIVCEEIGRFKLLELAEPIFTEGEAIVRIKRIGICGTDFHAYKGNQPFFTYPRMLGHELAGIIEQIGDNDAGLKAGDQVSIIPYLHCGHCIACRTGKTNCCTDLKVIGVHVDGGMRELISVPLIHLIATNGLSLDQSAVLEPFAIGAHAVRRAAPHQGETVLVIGGGPIGLGVMAFAKYAGARVIAMDVKDDRLAYCRSWAKVDETVHALREPERKLSELTSGDGPTVVFDATGNAKSMTDAFGLAAHGGKLVYVGLVKGDISFHDPEFHRRELTLMASRNAAKEDFEHVYEAVQSGSIDVGRYITHRSSFEAMIGEFESWMKPESRVIKAMIDCP